MATAMTFLINYVNANVAYVTTPADYILLDDLTNDYLIWSATLADLLTHEPTTDELNENATIISDSAATTIAKCLLMDYSHYGGYYTRLVKGMGENKQYVFAFRFNGITATEPKLEAWDTSAHTTYLKHVLGAGTPASSMLQAKCTTTSLPGTGDWTSIAGLSNYIRLNDGTDLDPHPLSGAKDLYCNLKIKIPVAYATPAAETFVLTVRYTYL